MSNVQIPKALKRSLEKAAPKSPKHDQTTMANTAFMNSVRLLIDNPCNTPWYVYAETAVPSAGKALLILLGFGMGDVVRGMLRPRGLRGFGPGKRDRRGRGGRGRPGKRGIPEIGNLIGRTIAPIGQHEATYASGEKLLWKIDGVAQTGLWYFLIAGVIKDFFSIWQTAILERNQFNCSGVSAMAVHKSEFVITPLNDWVDPGSGACVWGTCPPFPGPFWKAGPKGAFVTFAASAKPLATGIAGPTFEARLTSGNERNSAGGFSAFGTEVQAVTSLGVAPGETVSGEVRCDGSAYRGSYDFVAIDLQ